MKGILFFLFLFSIEANGQSIRYTYDSLHRIKQVENADGSVTKYSYDPNGNKISYSITSLRCSLSDRYFYADTGNHSIVSFKWQVNTGTGFSNISDNQHYEGTNTAILHISHTPTSWYGHSYRCFETLDNNSTTFNTPIRLTFALQWNGTINDSWENPLNWSCGVVPDGNTDVIINSLSTRYPVVYETGMCRSLNIAPGSSVLVKSGIVFKIIGK